MLDQLRFRSWTICSIWLAGWLAGWLVGIRTGTASPVSWGYLQVCACFWPPDPVLQPRLLSGAGGRTTRSSLCRQACCAALRCAVLRMLRHAAGFAAPHGVK